MASRPRELAARHRGHLAAMHREPGKPRTTVRHWLDRAGISLADHR